jgi:hypothetical protein
VENENTNAVWVALGVTKNLGNYENVKIDAGIRLVIDPSESVSETYERAWSAVEEEVERQISSLNEQMDR